MSDSKKTIKELDAEARQGILAAKAVIEDRQNRTPEEVQGAIKSLENFDGIVKRLEAITGENALEALKTVNRIENSIAALNQPDRPYLGGGAGTDGTRLTLNGDGSIKSLGRSFVEDPAVQHWLKSIAPGGRVPSDTMIRSPVIEVKALITTAVDVAAGRPHLGQADRQGRVVGLGWNPLAVRDLITVIRITKEAVEVVREKARTVNAAFVAEATDAEGVSGLKPLSTFEMEIVTANVKSIAHGVAATTRVLDDSDLLAGRIDSFVRMGLDQEEERAVLLGDTGVNTEEFTGIYNTAGMYSQAFDTDILRTSRLAKTKLMALGLVMPTSYLMNPYDWQEFDLLKDLEGRYYFGGPLVMGTPRIWGVPVTESLYAVQGTPLIGRFTDAVLYDRQQTNVQVFTQHSDWARRNLVLIQGERRAAFLVERPRSFCDFAMGA